MVLGFVRKSSIPPVQAQLVGKGEKLARNAVVKNDTADSLIRQAGDLTEQAKVDAAHAAAVQKALTVLEEAGVTL
jgi:hypothetical protein